MEPITERRFGGGEIDNGLFEVLHLIGRTGRILHPVEDPRHRRSRRRLSLEKTVLAGTSSTCSMTLRRRPMRSMKGDNQAQARLQGAGIAPEAL